MSASAQHRVTQHRVIQHRVTQHRVTQHRDPPHTRARYRDVLGAAEFRAIFAANIVSMLGSVVAAVALTVLVYQQTRSPALAASVMALSFLPYLIGGALLGAAADRLPARRVLVACDLTSAALIGCMVIPGMPLPALLTLLFVVGLISPVYQGVRSAVLPEVLPPGPRYVLGRALMRMVAQSAQVIGYGVGGLLLTILSPRGALAADAVSFVASGLVLRFGTAARPGSAARRGSMARDSLAGLRNVFTHRPTRRILLFSWLLPACVVAPEALAAPYATHIGQPARAAGFLLMGLPIGTVAADIVAARLLTSRLQRRIIVPAALLCFAPLAAFAASPGLVLAVGLLAAAGLGSAWTAGIDGLLIDTVPPDLRNRALALAGAGLMFTQGAGFALWGLAGQYLSVTVVIPLAATAGVVAATILRPRRAAGGAARSRSDTYRARREGTASLKATVRNAAGVEQP
ncbi:MAG TPA: MFS transporter [Streptosporangiaceae bacterium]|nr:MFS transporter [Streptosporangiaceae bacterium]